MSVPSGAAPEDAIRSNALSASGERAAHVQPHQQNPSQKSTVKTVPSKQLQSNFLQYDHKTYLQYQMYYDHYMAAAAAAAQAAAAAAAAQRQQKKRQPQQPQQEQPQREQRQQQQQKPACPTARAKAASPLRPKPFEDCPQNWKGDEDEDARKAAWSKMTGEEQMSIIKDCRKKVHRGPSLSQPPKSFADQQKDKSPDIRALWKGLGPKARKKWVQEHKNVRTGPVQKLRVPEEYRKARAGVPDAEVTAEWANKTKEQRKWLLAQYRFNQYMEMQRRYRPVTLPLPSVTRGQGQSQSGNAKFAMHAVYLVPQEPYQVLDRYLTLKARFPTEESWAAVPAVEQVDLIRKEQTRVVEEIAQKRAEEISKQNAALAAEAAQKAEQERSKKLAKSLQAKSDQLGRILRTGGMIRKFAMVAVKVSQDAARRFQVRKEKLALQQKKDGAPPANAPAASDVPATSLVSTLQMVWQPDDLQERQLQERSAHGRGLPTRKKMTVLRKGRPLCVSSNMDETRKLDAIRFLTGQLSSEALAKIGLTRCSESSGGGAHDWIEYPLPPVQAGISMKDLTNFAAKSKSKAAARNTSKPAAKSTPESAQPQAATGPATGTSRA
jgi:hypothetical protein